MSKKTTQPKNLTNKTPSNFLAQFVLNFVLPIFVLTRLSTPDRLGPVKGLLLALAFPILYELFSVYKRRKINITSVIVIGGILLTGALGLLRVDAFWLAIRRAMPYVLIALVVIISQLIKRPLLQKLLSQILDLKKVEDAARANHSFKKLQTLYVHLTYMVVILCSALAISGFVTTKTVVTSPPLSSAFNNELAQLRIYNIPTVIIPLIVGSFAILLYLFFRLEKITGVDTEKLLK